MKKTIYQKDYSVSSPYIDKSARRDWVSFGERNNFMDNAIEIASSSPIQNSILQSKLTYCLGGGLVPFEKSVLNPNLVDSWSDMFEKCMSDFVIFDAFALQIILNNDGSTMSFYHQPINQVRLGQYNERNIIEKGYLCTDWTKATSKNVVEVPMFGSEPLKKGQAYLAYFKRYRANELYYAIPSWWSAANWVLADASLSKYYLNYINNNFSANLAITYPTEIDEEKKEELYKLLVESFGGSKNAGNILLLFGENGVLPQISPIESVNADLYNSVADMILKYIVSANRLTSPILVGLATSSGFSSKSDEILAAYSQYMITVINECRNFVLGKLNDMLQLNGYDRLLRVQDYDLRAEFEGETEKNDIIEDESIGVQSDENNEELNVEKNG